MDTVQTIAAETARQVPGIARFYLWGVSGFCVLASFCIAMAVCAGPRPAGGSIWKTYALVVVVMLLIQSGYLAAPFAVHASWWKWSFWAMAPLGALLVLGILFPMVNSLRWTPPEGTSRLTGLVRMGIPGVFATVIYAGPPALLWWLRR